MEFTMSARLIDANNITDASWVKQSFMMDQSTMQSSQETLIYRTLSSASFKFADTTPGGNQAINPPPQFCRYADIKVGGRGGDYQANGTFRPSTSRGMGRYYSEAIDDNAVHCFMRFGVPMYNSLTNFFTNFYNAEASAMARTGRGTSLFYKAGAAIGFVVGIVPRALVFMGNVIKWFANRPASKYYYLKPAMPLYWNAVTTIVNTLAVNMGIIAPVLPLDSAKGTVEDYGGPDDYSGSLTQKQLNSALSSMLPEIFRPDGGIDVYSISTRYHRLWMAYRNAGYATIANSGVDDTQSNSPAQWLKIRQALGAFQTQAIAAQNSAISQLPSTNSTTDGNGNATTPTGMDAYLQAYMSCQNQTNWSGGGNYFGSPANNTPAPAPAGTSGSSGDSSAATGGGTSSGGTDTSLTPDDITAGIAETIDNPNSNTPNFGGVQGPAGSPPSSTGWWDTFANFLEAELADGGAFVAFRVDGTGTISESFSSSTKESDIQSKINSMSASNRETRFQLEGGNLGSGAVTGFATAALGAITDFAQGLASQVGLGGLAALAGSAFVDIPQEWDSATANLPHADFTIQLRTPYGNKMSRLLNLYIPLAMLLAGALPLATGKQSYTAPFLVEAYCRGRFTTRLGVIDSLTISRGAGNIGWTDEGEPLGIDVSFSIKDLSSVMFMPISANYGNFGLAQGLTMAAGQLLGGTAGEAVAANLLNSTWDDDNAYTDYMAVLGSLTMIDQVSPTRKWKLRMTNQIQNFNSWKSAQHAASWAGGTWLGRALSLFVPFREGGQTGA
jgi:hypothetical protein